MIEIALMALINRARGGLVPSWWDKITQYLPRNLDYTIAVAFVLYLLTNNTTISLYVALAMYIGSLDGWGKWIGSILDRVDQKHEKEGLLGINDYIATKLHNSYLVQSYIAISIRGFQWLILPFILLAYYGYGNYVYNTILAVIGGISWVLALEIARYDFINPKNSWGLSEWLYGAIQGLLLLLIVNS